MKPFLKTVAITAVCLVAFGASWPSNAHDCKWGCTNHELVGDHPEDGDERKKIGERPYVTFYVRNIGPLAIWKLAIAPNWYEGWGCGPAWMAWECNRLQHRIEPGTTHLFRVFYDDHEGEVFDVRIVDSEGIAAKGKDIRIPLIGRIPTLVVRSSSSDRNSPTMSMHVPE